MRYLADRAVCVIECVELSCSATAEVADNFRLQAHNVREALFAWCSTLIEDGWCTVPRRLGEDLLAPLWERDWYCSSECRQIVLARQALDTSDDA